MFAAAGIVVTEISAPISAPDFAVERLSIPAAPRAGGDEEREESGSAMMFARLCCGELNVSGNSPVSLKACTATYTAKIVSGKPT